MKTFKQIVYCYLAIGLLIGAHAWFSDQYSTARELILIPLIALLWPLWCLIQMMT